MPQLNVPSVEEKPAKAIRMTFAFDGEHVHLVSQQTVDMVLPPSDPLRGHLGANFKRAETAVKWEASQKRKAVHR